jgi:hypothetical protein
MEGMEGNFYFPTMYPTATTFYKNPRWIQATKKQNKTKSSCSAVVSALVL